MTSRDDSLWLAQVEAGTPMGDLLRRYWHPVAPVQALTEEHATAFVRILGEDLVLFRDRTGRVGLLADHCAHRGASLCYGRVEERGIACAYHGWLYDTEGTILETPPEKNQAIMRHVRQTAYPVKPFVGLYWAYLGPLPAPVIPRYDVWVREDGRRSLEVFPTLDCHWLQTMENSMDPDHLQILHQEFFGRGRTPASTTRGFIDERAMESFYRTDYGIMKRRIYHNGKVDEHPLIFPNILRHGNETQIRVPVDARHTLHFRVRFHPYGEGQTPAEDEEALRLTVVAPFKQPAEGTYPQVRYDLRSVAAQDYMAWETQGPIADRQAEHLSYSDRGIAMYRALLKEQVAVMEHGGTPLGVRYDAHAMIDTNLQQSLDSLHTQGTAGPR